MPAPTDNGLRPIPNQPPDNWWDDDLAPRRADEPPNDVTAEQELIGLALYDINCRTGILDLPIQPADFYRHAHELLWTALRQERDHTGTTSPALIAARLNTNNNLQLAGGLPYLHTLTEHATTIHAAPALAERIRALAATRQLAEQLQRARLRLNRGHDDPADTLKVVTKAFKKQTDHLATTDSATDPCALDIDTFLAGERAEEDYDWIIPGLLERMDRLLLTGPEGGGKSTFCRQVAVMAASGLHPFTAEKTRPARILYLDLENSARQSRRKLRPLRTQAGDLLDPTRLLIEVRSSGIDLLTVDDQKWLDQLITNAKPDLFITGPLYRMAAGDPNEERTAKPVSQALDRIRDQGCAVILETHSPHAQNGQRKRPTRPYGASLWMRWPEFGIWLDEDGAFEHWRGGRDERDWPVKMKRGGEWPWTPDRDPDALLWARIRQIRADFGAPMSVRDLEEALGGGPGASRPTIGRVLQRHETEWAKINKGDAA